MTGTVETARQYQEVFDVYWPIAAAVLVVVWLALLVLVVRYPSNPSHKARPFVHHR